MTTASRTTSTLIAIAIAALVSACIHSEAPREEAADGDAGMRGDSVAGRGTDQEPSGRAPREAAEADDRDEAQGPDEMRAPDEDVTNPTATEPAPCAAEVVATAVDVGVDSTCVVSEAGELYCWGRDTATDQRITTPTRVHGITGEVTSVALGGYHGCALTDRGVVWCWGVNDRGQLGNGTLDRSDVPTPVSNLTDAQQIASGFAHSCAIREGGEVWCWGNNEYGQFGVGPATVREPIAVWTNVNHAVQVTGGFEHTCIRDNADGVHCVGVNSHGQLGNGSHGSSARFVSLDVRARDVSAGLNHTCAVDVQGDVWCWGGNGTGQLGDGTDGGPIGDGMPAGRSSPVRVVDLHGIAKVRASHDHTCAISRMGQVECWGSNQFIALGYGTFENIGDLQLRPVKATLLGGSVRDLATGGSHTCAITSGRGLRCWGANGFGAVGDGTLDDRFAPVAVPGLGCD